MVTIMTVGAAVSSGEFSDEIGARDAAKAVSVDSGGAALDMLLEKQVDLVIVDETLKDMSGLDLARQVAVKNPLAAVALVSPLSEEAFHETTEGLGLLAQLPPHPRRSDARVLLEKFARVVRMTERVGG
ncbi:MULTISPECIES: response regulator [Desulfococcus]|uniref:Response regulator receiver protein n=1 Tax=Desulfococcus multivorans DSM 2059 TaxID=1121405 RepID=S7U2X4_DESML|nr:response regulator [Desulfococcus multivorans]AOY58536.1 response regulator receiver protein [Desulfococcus multivorans]EPR43320.1 response regulator receiver protein [Desulfococcus multivorans DSM 2059]SJZ42692.1 Response regulator receiver domain-containing protein [Desulfococcus multivorans DSM 2059]